jgi:hypothetical protein
LIFFTGAVLSETLAALVLAAAITVAIPKQALAWGDCWDTQFVDALAQSPPALAQMLIATITPDQKTHREGGALASWAMETFTVAKSDAYGDPPLSKEHFNRMGAALCGTGREGRAGSTDQSRRPPRLHPT